MQNTIAWVMVSLMLVGLAVFMFLGHRPAAAPPAATRGAAPPGRFPTEYPNLYIHIDAENARYTFVMLLKKPRRLDRPTLTRAAENAFHIQFNQSKENRLLIQPRPGLFAVITPSLRLGLITSTRPYYEDAELPAILDREHDPAVRQALEDHEAWLGVDWFGDLPEGGVEQAFEQICKLAAELLGDDVMALTCTTKKSFHMYVPADREILRGPNPLSLFEVAASGPSGEAPRETK